MSAPVAQSIHWYADPADAVADPSPLSVSVAVGFALMVNTNVAVESQPTAFVVT